MNKTDDIAQFCLYVMHRLFLATYIFYSFLVGPTLKLFRRTSQVKGLLKKRPKHLLIKTDPLAQGNNGDQLVSDCIKFANAYGIEYLTIIDKSNTFCRENIDLNGAKLYRNHKIVQKGDGKTSVNLLSVDQKQHYINRLRGLYEDDTLFRFGPENLLPSVTPFPPVDLILSTCARPTYADTLPPQIGFAEIW